MAVAIPEQGTAHRRRRRRRRKSESEEEIYVCALILVACLKNNSSALTGHLFGVHLNGKERFLLSGKSSPDYRVH